MNYSRNGRRLLIEDRIKKRKNMVKSIFGVLTSHTSTYLSKNTMQFAYLHLCTFNYFPRKNCKHISSHINTFYSFQTRKRMNGNYLCGSIQMHVIDINRSWVSMRCVCVWDIIEVSCLSGCKLFCGFWSRWDFEVLSFKKFKWKILNKR